MELDRRIGGGDYNNCITLHQPWASLLVHGIKRIEGRSWSCPIRGRLWIHAASRVPEGDTIQKMEEFYRQLCTLDGVENVKFPKFYPVSHLLGCVDVVGCLYKEELSTWEGIPLAVRLEAQTDYCWLCENPQRLVVPLEMSGRQGVYKLQRQMSQDAPRALRPSLGPVPITFPRLDPADLFSLRPGCLQGVVQAGRTVPRNPLSSSKLDASIAGAQIAALQFRSPNSQSHQRPSSPSASRSVRGEFSGSES